MHWISRYTDVTYALFRFVIGFLFATHGAQKLFGVPGTQPIVPVGSLFGAAGIIELVCGVMVALGALTSIAAFVASGEMAFAYFMAHAPHGFWPILNKGELAVVYCFVFLYIASRGDGRYSLGAAFRKRGEAPSKS